MPLSPYVCLHCGFWQRWFATPPACPVCSDVRNALPPDGWSFAHASEVAARTQTSWARIGERVWAFCNEPALGLGATGWLIVRNEGNIAFEAAGYYSPSALDFIASLGGIRYASTSHPHGCGALWQLQDVFDAHVAVQREGLGWSKAFRVTLPYDATLDLGEGCSLHELGGHYEGHALLYDAPGAAVYCGDALKLEYDERGELTGLSAHKAFHQQIPLTPREIRHYRDTFAALAFSHIFTTFDQAPLDRAAVLAFYDELLAAPPTTAPRPL